MKKLQQGDVIIRSIVKIPEGVNRVSKTARGFILAEGEATGHAHVIEDDIEMYEKDGVLFIKVDTPITVRHEEHDQISLSKGIYEIGFVREYDFSNEEIRRIRD